MPAIDKELRERIERWQAGGYADASPALVDALISALEAAAPVADAVEAIVYDGICGGQLFFTVCGVSFKVDCSIDTVGDLGPLRIGAWHKWLDMRAAAVAALAKRRGE